MKDEDGMYKSEKISHDIVSCDWPCVQSLSELAEFMLTLFLYSGVTSWQS
jgi:hypothetical protein